MEKSVQNPALVWWESQNDAGKNWHIDRAFGDDSFTKEEMSTEQIELMYAKRGGKKQPPLS